MPDEADEGERQALTQFPPVPVYASAYGPPVVEISPDGSETVMERPVHPLAVSKLPPAPPPGKYICFGDVFDPDERTKTLEEEGREVLFATSSDGSPVNGAAEVKRLCNIAIAKYSDYCKALADIDDTSAASKGEEFTNLFINILYLVNQFRPVQGRQVLIDMLKRQAEERRSVAKKLNAAIESSQAAIDAAMVKSRTNVSKLTEQSDKRDLDGTTTTTATRDPVEEAVDQSSVNVFDI